jgi:hypothetical protein
MQIVQTKEEVIRLFDEYGRGFAPSDLVLNSQNAKAMLDYALGKYGLVSISYLIEAERTLGLQLQREKQPTPEEQAVEQAKRLEAKMREDYRKSIAPQPSFEQRVKAEQAKKAAEDAAKQQEQAESAIKSAIDSYECYKGPNRVDWLRTNQLRADLRNIEVRINGKRDAVRTLEKVREAISNMP